MKFLRYFFGGVILLVMCFVAVFAIFPALDPSERNLYGVLSFIGGVIILHIGYDYIWNHDSYHKKRDNY